MRSCWLLIGLLILAVAIAPAAFAQDVTPPELVAFDIAPSVVNVSSGDQRVTFSGRLVDDLSGPRGGSVVWSSPSGALVLASGFTAQAGGTFTNSETISQFSESGTWVVNSVRIRDQMLNFVSIDTTELAALGFPSTFEGDRK